MRDRSRPPLLARHSNLKAPVWQKLEQSAAKFRSSIRAKDDQANDGRAHCPELVVQPFPPNESGTGESRKKRFPLVTRSALELGAARISLTDQPTRGVTFSRALTSPLRAFRRVLPTLGGPARATSTGQFARFKMLRVRSPIM